jgi:hypothetical protein
MEVTIPSFKRSENLKGKDFFLSAKYVVPESQRDEYAKEIGAKRLILIPDEADGNIAKKRNWILENLPRPLVMIDDDVSSLGHYESRRHGYTKRIDLDPADVDDFIKMSFDMCNQFNAKLWGLAQNQDNRIYKEFLPFSLNKISLGPFQGHLDHPLKFDESVGAKDDYDMALQQLNKYRKIFRWNKFHYMCEHGNNSGGCVATRSKEKEIEQCQRIMKKWGKRIISYKIPPEKITDLLNAKHVNVPIGGI